MERDFTMENISSYPYPSSLPRNRLSGGSSISSGNSVASQQSQYSQYSHQSLNSASVGEPPVFAAQGVHPYRARETEMLAQEPQAQFSPAAMPPLPPQTQMLSQTHTQTHTQPYSHSHAGRGHGRSKSARNNNNNNNNNKNNNASNGNNNNYSNNNNNNNNNNYNNSNGYNYRPRAHSHLTTGHAQNAHFSHRAHTNTPPMYTHSLSHSPSFSLSSSPTTSPSSLSHFPSSSSTQTYNLSRPPSGSAAAARFARPRSATHSFESSASYSPSSSSANAYVPLALSNPEMEYNASASGNNHRNNNNNNNYNNSGYNSKGNTPRDNGNNNSNKGSNKNNNGGEISPMHLHDLAFAKELAGEFSQALSIYREAAEKGVAVSQSNLGYLYLSGRGGIEPNVELALRCFLAAAMQGNAHALYRLGYCFETYSALPVVQSLRPPSPASSRWLSVVPLHALQHTYEDHNENNNNNRSDVDGNINSNNNDHNTSNSNTGGANNAAHNNPAHAHHCSVAKALRCYELAAEQGHLAATVSLAYFLLHGIEGLVPCDIPRAVELYAFAAHMGHPDALSGLAHLCLHGVLRERDFALAGYYYLQASHRAFSADTLYLAAYSYEQALVTSRTHSQTPLPTASDVLQYYSLAADRCHPCALNNAAMYHQHSIMRVCESNAAEAVRLLSIAADQQLVESIFNLGYCFERGVGVEVNPQAAMAYYQKVVDMGPLLYHPHTGTCWISDERAEMGYRRCLATKEVCALAARRLSQLLRFSGRHQPQQHAKEMATQLLSFACELEA